MSAAGATLTEPYIDMTTNKMVIGILSKVSSSVGVVGGDLALDGLVQIINSLNFGGMGYASWSTTRARSWCTLTKTW